MDLIVENEFVLSIQTLNGASVSITTIRHTFWHVNTHQTASTTD